MAPVLWKAIPHMCQRGAHVRGDREAARAGARSGIHQEACARGRQEQRCGEVKAAQAGADDCHLQPAAAVARRSKPNAWRLRLQQHIHT